MKATLSNPKGKITHKDILLHEHSVPAREEEHAAS